MILSARFDGQTGVNATVWLDADNTLDLWLYADGVLADLSGVTRVRAIIGNADVDSDSSPAAVDWSAGGGKVVLRLGAHDITPGLQALSLIVYDATYTLGRVWVHGVPVYVAQATGVRLLPGESLVLRAPDGTLYMVGAQMDGTIYTVEISESEAVDALLFRAPDATVYSLTVGNDGTLKTEVSA